MKTKNIIIKLLLILFLLSFPTQIAKHFWPTFSIFWGLKMDYLSIAVYLSDVIFMLLLVSELLFGNLFDYLKKAFSAKIYIFALFGLLLIRSILAFSPVPAIFAFGKAIEFLFAFIVLKKEKELIKKYLGLIILFWIGFELVLAAAQFIYQSSLQGIFWYFGERNFSISTPGIAKTSIMGRLFLRPYGTFSHPNSLAGFTLASMAISFVFVRSKGLKRLISLLGFILLLLTFSRSSWLALLIIAFLGLFINLKEKILKILILVLGVVVSAFIYSQTDFSQMSILLRRWLNISAIEMIKDNFLFGVGLNNFIPQLPAYWPKDKINYLFFQPAHNIYLLLISEIGFIGMLLLAFSFKEFFSKQKWQLIRLIPLLAILVTGLFDHYWLTLQQNNLMVILVLALI